MSAAEDTVPPTLTFKKLSFKHELSEGAPPGTKFACSEGGWIISKVFVQWMKLFTATVKPSTDNKVLIVLDGYLTHTTNLEAIEFSKGK
jgi:hypothetical protein